MKKTILLAVAICLAIAFSASLASEAVVSYYEKAAFSTEKTAPNNPLKNPNQSPNMLLTDYITEGFEVTVPPTGWTQTITVPGYTWAQSSSYAFSGTYGAYCPYDYNQYEELITPALDFTSATSDLRVEFMWEGSYYWMVTPYNNGEYELWISTDGGATWPTLLWSLDSIGAFTSWEWYLQSVDLSTYAGQSNVKLAWRYDANDAADIGLDDVLITDDPPPVAPVNDLCANAINIPTVPAQISGTTLGATIDCSDNPNWNGNYVWYTVSAPNAANDISISYCPSLSAIPTVSAILYSACPTTAEECSTLAILYTNAGFITCPSTLTNAEINWKNLPGPATYYIPVQTGSLGMDFIFDIDVTVYVPPTPDYTITLPASLPYDHLGQTTCGMDDDFSTTCLGYYDGGPDVVYEIILTAPMCLEFVLDSDSTYPGMALSDHFPMDATCIDYVTSYAAGQLVMTGQELAAGTYYLMVDDWPTPVCIDYDLHIRSCTPPPANDSCQYAQVVGNVINLPWSTAFATPDSDAYIYSNAIWYSYTATSAATVFVSLCGSSFDTRLEIFEGASCDPLGAIVGQDDDSCDDGINGLASYCHFLPTSGQTYLIKVGGYSTNSGDGVLTIEAGDPIFGVTPTSISGTAPLNGSDTDTLTVTNTGTASLNFTALGTQDPFLRRIQRESMLNARNASVAASTNEVQTPFAIAPGYAGNTYKEKPVNNVIPPAANPNMILQGGDDIATATVITSLPYTDGGTTAGYLHNYDEVCPYGPHTSPDVVYSFTPAVDTYIVADICNSLYDTKMFIYQDGETPGTPVACNDDACGSDGYKSRIGRTQIFAGSTYYIVIDGYGGASGTYEFNMDYTTAPPLPPVNDDCANAIQITTFPAVVTGTTDGATVDCPGVLDWNAVWYEFDAPFAENTVNLNFCDNSVTLSPIGIVLYSACPGDINACSTTYIIASSYDFTSCPGVTNATMQWMNLPGPATYYLPIITGDPGVEQAFTFNLDVVNFEPCEITCPVGSIPEVELCGEDLNGGCNATVPAFEPVAVNQTICGTTYADGSTRDTDWYTLTIDHASTIIVTGVAEFPYQLLIIDAGIGDCSDDLVLAAGTADPCSTATVSYSVPAGTYYIWAGPSVFAGIACDGSGTYTTEYYFTVTTTPVWLALAAEGSIPAGSDPVKVPVYMDGYGLAAGTYTGNIRFETNDPLNATYDVPVTFTITSGGTCEYLIGDISGDNQRLGGDVTYGVRYFKGIGVRPPDSCYMDSTGGYLYVAGDCNGNCEFRGSDITRLVAYFKGNAQLSCCHFFPTTLPPILRNTHPTDPAKAE